MPNSEEALTQAFSGTNVVAMIRGLLAAMRKKKRVGQKYGSVRMSVDKPSGRVSRGTKRAITIAGPRG